MMSYIDLHKFADCMFLLCHVRISEPIHTLWLPECQGPLCLKQVQNLASLAKWFSVPL